MLFASGNQADRISSMKDGDVLQYFSIAICYVSELTGGYLRLMGKQQCEMSSPSIE